MSGRFFRQVEKVKSLNALSPELPFSALLSEQSIHDLCRQLQIAFRCRIYTPAVTLWVFLSQVLAADQSCRNAVAKFVAFRVRRGEPAPSLETGSYCQARSALPEKMFSDLAKRAGRELHEQSRSVLNPFNRTVKVVDGSTASMPDSCSNASHFGKAKNQHGEVGFPIVRFVAVFCLATGAMIDLMVGPYAGKRTGELTLFRKLKNVFSPGDILLADRLFCNFCDIAILLNQGVDVVMRIRQSRKVDFRKGKKLGREDHVVTWYRPDHCPEWLTHEQFQRLPETLSIRELKVRIEQPGFRSREIIVMTTLTDVTIYSKNEVGDLFRQRWQAELDLRSIKCVLQMDVLRCQSPEMVRKEIWAHMLAYNLIRSVMCAAAHENNLQVRQISFKGVQQLVNAFFDAITTAQSRPELRQICDTLLTASLCHHVGNRPNRFEPRKRKRHPKPYPKMKLSRNQERSALLKMG